MQINLANAGSVAKITANSILNEIDFNSLRLLISNAAESKLCEVRLDVSQLTEILKTPIKTNDLAVVQRSPGFNSPPSIPFALQLLITQLRNFDYNVSAIRDGADMVLAISWQKHINI